MFTHTVTIVRPDTSAAFFYDAEGILSNGAYQAMIATAQAQGKILSETFTVSPDQLTLVRQMTWDTVQSFNDFFAAYKANVHPNYEVDFSNYNLIHSHVAQLDTQTT